MPANHLEQLVAEWYEFQEYFVRRNVLVGRRDKGGWECELDVVAFHPGTKHLVHIEPSGDADRWDERERRFAKKFTAGQKYIPGLFAGLPIPKKIEQIALFSMGSTRNKQEVGGGRIMLLKEFLAQIKAGLQGRSFRSAAVSENMPLLRMVQMVAEYS